MNKAVNIVKRWQTFIAKADAYMHGQVNSATINDPYLLETYVFSTFPET